MSLVESCREYMLACGENSATTQMRIGGGKEVVTDFLQSDALRLFWFRSPKKTKLLAREILGATANLLQAVVLLPPDFRDESGKYLSLFILDRTRTTEQTLILFADASKLEHIEKQNLNFKTLTHVCKDYRDIVLRKEPLDANFHLSLFLNPKTLADVADIIPTPIFLKKNSVQEEIETFCRLSPKAYSPYGYTHPRICRENEERPFLKGRVREKHFLRGNDILFVTQSNVGKICLIDPEFQEKGWIPSSFNLIIRAKAIDPRFLYMFLSSDMVKKYVQNSLRYNNTTFPLISSLCLKSLPLPNFSDKVLQQTIESFEKTEEIRKERERLDKKALAYAQFVA